MAWWATDAERKDDTGVHPQTSSRVPEPDVPRSRFRLTSLPRSVRKATFRFNPNAIGEVLSDGGCLNETVSTQR